MASPLTASDFKAACEAHLDCAPEHIVLAVSGGADSMALLALGAEAFPGRVTVLTINHQLRDEAADEATFVQATCQSLGIPHHTLVWAESASAQASSGNLQQQARDARYQLMTNWCRSNGASVLVTAHHRSDQAETVLQNLSRASGVDGLAGMPHLRDLDGIKLLRPLLGVTKNELEALCKARGIDWVEDPSNQDDTYNRVKWRKAAGRLAELGLTEAGLTQTAGHMARAKSALDYYARLLISDAAQLDRFGGVTLHRDPLFAAPAETQLRALARILTAVGGRAHRPDVGQLAALLAELSSGEMKCTLGGAIVSLKSDRITFRREARHLPSDITISKPSRLFWDDRALWQIGDIHAPLTLKKLNHEDWGLVDKDFDQPALPADLRTTVPALYDQDGPLAAPVVGFWRETGLISQFSCDWSPLESKLGLRVQA